MVSRNLQSSLSRRSFLRTLAATPAVLGGLAFHNAWAASDRSPVFRIDDCPVHDGRLRHQGVDALLQLLAENGIKFYQSDASHPWAGTSGIIARNDVVVIKVNCQWKCRGTTNTDLVRGVIHRILDHPEGFTGEIVIIENGQSQGAFNGFARGWNYYRNWPEIQNNVHINAEDETVLTIDYLVNTVFAGKPVSSFLLDPIRATFIASDDHATNGYRKLGSGDVVSYPCITTAGVHRIELKEGLWTGSTYADNVKFINIPVLKDHSGSGMTGVLKHMYGVMSMSDQTTANRHYTNLGSQVGKMWSQVRTPDLNILDCIWVCHEQICGYPESGTRRCNTLLAGLDPVAMDYYAAKNILLPLGGSQATQHDPDTFSGLIGMLQGAQTTINANGGIHGDPTRQGDANIEVISRSAVGWNAASGWMQYV